MSRSPEAPRARRTTAALVLAAALVLPAGTAIADEHPIVPMYAPVLPIISATQDIGGIATVDEKDKKVDVKLDANVLFAKDSAVIKPTANARIIEVAKVLKARKAGKVTVLGFTDDLGSAAHGLKLSQQRAAAVAAKLKPYLPAAQFPTTVQGRGESGFVAPNTSEANRKKNRRVEIHFVAS